MQNIEQTIEQTPALTPAPASAALPDGFVKVEGGATEQVTETASLIAAYLAIWIILMAFTFVTFKALRSLRAQAERTGEVVRRLSRESSQEPT